MDDLVFDGLESGQQRSLVMEMTWENLTKLFVWAAKKGSDAPLADRAGETLVIDGAVTKEDFERFMESESRSPTA
jgi:hypothetical protein